MPTEKILQVSIPHESERQRIKDLARSRGLSVSAFIRTLIFSELKEEAKAQA